MRLFTSFSYFSGLDFNGIHGISLSFNEFWDLISIDLNPWSDLSEARTENSGAFQLESVLTSCENNNTVRHFSIRTDCSKEMSSDIFI